MFYNYTSHKVDREETAIKVYDFDSDIYYFPEGLVTAITACSYVTNFGDTAINYTDYELDNNVLRFKDTITAYKLSISYYAGYITIPTALDQVLAQIMSFLWTYSDRKVFLSGNGEAILAPNDVVIPKVIRDAMAVYRV